MDKTATLWLKTDEGVLAGIAVDPMADLLPLVVAMRYLGQVCVEAGLAHNVRVMVVDEEEQWCVQYAEVSVVPKIPPGEAEIPLPAVEWLERYPCPS